MMRHWKEVQTRRMILIWEEIKGVEAGNPVGMIRPEDTVSLCGGCRPAIPCAGLVDFSMELLQILRFQQRRKRSDGISPYFEGNMAHIASDGPEKRASQDQWNETMKKRYRNSFYSALRRKSGSFTGCFPDVSLELAQQ